MTPEEAAALREEGKLNYLQAAGDREKIARGITQLMKAVDSGDPEAMCIIGEHMLRGRIKPMEGDPAERALSLLQSAAWKGEPRARVVLNRHFLQKRTGAAVRSAHGVKNGPLTDFDGKRIKINRKGLLVPVDAKLSYSEEEGNVLRFDANLFFAWLDDGFDTEAVEQAVLEGVRLWEGSYFVFGGQKLRVRINLTREDRLLDSVMIFPVTDTMRGILNEKLEKSRFTPAKAEKIRTLAQRRSFAGMMPLKPWGVRMPKMIYLQSRDDSFTDLYDLKHTAKHEFGHILGIGDLYQSEEDGLSGVEKGSYKELDRYYISDKIYHQVMCDHFAPVSDNDVEMVVLAFSENKYQRFQPDQTGKTVSKALGKGN